MGVDPCTREYKQECLRSELFSSLERGEMKPFSSKKLTRRWRNSKFTHIKIYCKYRGIEEGLIVECEECKEWFHKECCDVPQVLFSKSEDLQWTGPAWTATESTCAILYCVNFFNMCIVKYKLFVFLGMHVYLQYLQCMCCLLVVADFFHCS